ncbi:hypothetical protein IscW_ISCW024132 [Ixodes scapularis]|uniref:Uncharacterized protein n=1 Tax=Ixodes scapularis TaxID=6945 RepID=B7PAB7_IXOSC|nr:hypothetical protein IscW_ISCW024132 [Ixodes scapularis]|eukprot:XP_002406704.1 hypothetical protein IscW_ISCW024132 [Ixodes scapularis]
MPYCRPGLELCRNWAVRVDVLLTALWSVEKARRCSRKVCNAICVVFVLFLQSLPLVVLRRAVIVSSMPSITLRCGFPHIFFSRL